MDVLYIITFAIVWSTSSPAMKVADVQFDVTQLPSFFLTPRGRTYISLSLLALSACVIALLVWGFLHMKWYHVILSVIYAFSFQPSRVFFSTRSFYATVAWIVVTGLTIYFWCK